MNKAISKAFESSKPIVFPVGLGYLLGNITGLFLPDILDVPAELAGLAIGIWFANRQVSHNMKIAYQNGQRNPLKK